MNRLPDNYIAKFLSGERLTEEEFGIIDMFLHNPKSHHYVYHWLEEIWRQSPTETNEPTFEPIRDRVSHSSSQTKVHKLYTVFSKVAAILLIPLLVSFFYFYSYQPESVMTFLTLSTQKGYQTSVNLPDGSKVWLNVDSKLTYPVDYGVNSRNVKLEGEAYFEVKKNTALPFIVTSGNIVTQALGTRFVITAYPESPVIRASLIDGSVEISSDHAHNLLNPGQQLVYYKDKSEVVIHSFDKQYELAWKNKLLAFHLTPFAEVITELEKWYSIHIEYNPALFKSETLTVCFESSETLEHVLQVMSKANDFTYSIKNNNVRITK